MEMLKGNGPAGASAHFRSVWVMAALSIAGLLWITVSSFKGRCSSRDVLLFGGHKGWHRVDWTAVDDRVRGGQSISNLAIVTLSDKIEMAHFYGHLDTKTLGGAGFASQRSSPLDRKGRMVRFNGSGYTGIMLKLHCPTPSDQRFSLNLFTDQSFVSWKYSFACTSTQVNVPWSSFVKTYRGRPVLDDTKLDESSIVSMSIMYQSFFGEQYSGPFSLYIQEIAFYA